MSKSNYTRSVGSSAARAAIHTAPNLDIPTPTPDSLRAQFARESAMEGVFGTRDTLHSLTERISRTGGIGGAKC